MSEVRYAVGGGNRWNTTVVDSVDSSAGCSLVLDRNGSPHIIYGTQFLGLAGNSRLRYARRDQTGQWVIDRMVLGPDAGEFNALAIDARGYLHVAYFHGNGRDQWGELRYARSRGRRRVRTRADPAQPSFGRGTGRSSPSSLRNSNSASRYSGSAAS